MRPTGKTVVRVAIAIVVLIGLVFASRSAVDQWRQQRDAALDRLIEIDRAIAESTSQHQRESLVAQRAVIESGIPTLSNLEGRWIVGAAILYALGLIPGGMVLHEGARVCGYPVPVRDAIAAQVIGHLGKYVPGKAMVVVIRAGRLKQSGVPLVAGSLAVLMETLLMMASGAAVAGVLIFLLPVDRWIAWAAFGGGMMAAVPTLPPILIRIVGRLTKPTSIVSSQGWRFFCTAWVWQLAAWGLIGGSFCCLVISLPGVQSVAPSAVLYPAAVASIALAMVVGFVSLLPGGAGIRELVLSVVLAPVVGGGQALLAAILARLLFIAVELAAAFLVTGLRRSTPKGCRIE